MVQSFVAKSSVTIRADAAKVWDALTNPKLIKQYLYGTEAISLWKEGGSITYRGIWKGRPYEDKGVIKKIEPNKLLVSTYWSSLSGLPDSPENHSTVTYTLDERDGETTLTVTTDNIDTKKAADHTENNWKSVLESLKKLLEEYNR
jgi:uncharacterized protein YndB with AHSA1/START domain